MKLEELFGCKKCGLHESRNNIVPGKGSSEASIVFIGEAPGRNEDLQGEPFVGRAGEILDELLDFIGLKRENVYITNVVKCRPPNNRNPTVDEIKICKPYLDKELKIINPKIICPMGNFATKYILKKHGLKIRQISEVHGKLIKLNTLLGTKKIIPLYHPAYALYNPNKISVLKKDFKKIID